MAHIIRTIQTFLKSSLPTNRLPFHILLCILREIISYWILSEAKRVLGGINATLQISIRVCMSSNRQMPTYYIWILAHCPCIFAKTAVELNDMIKWAFAFLLNQFQHIFFVCSEDIGKWSDINSGIPPTQKYTNEVIFFQHKGSVIQMYTM